jgi:hypothetical protein
MCIVETAAVDYVRASAVTVYPFIFVSPNVLGRKEVLTHELVHYEQQKRWTIYGCGIGLLLWFALYLFCLPVCYNPFRRAWETEAFEAEGFTRPFIHEILKGAPYYLR